MGVVVSLIILAVGVFAFEKSAFMGRPISKHRGKSVELPSGQYRGKHILNKMCHRNAYDLKPDWEYNSRKSLRNLSEIMMYAELHGNMKNCEIKNSQDNKTVFVTLNEVTNVADTSDTVNAVGNVTETGNSVFNIIGINACALLWRHRMKNSAKSVELSLRQHRGKLSRNTLSHCNEYPMKLETEYNSGKRAGHLSEMMMYSGLYGNMQKTDLNGLSVTNRVLIIGAIMSIVGLVYSHFRRFYEMAHKIMSDKATICAYTFGAQPHPLFSSSRSET